MDGLRPPDALVLSGNVAENWRKFQQRLEFYLEATEVEGKARSDKKKIATLLHVAGPEAVEVFNTFTLTSGERESYTTVLQRFEDYCTTKCNETYERYVFRCRMQGEGEQFESFYRDIQLKAQSCNFATLSDSFIRDQIVYGVLDRSLRERLLREENLTLTKTVQICKAAELTEEHKKIWSQTDKSVDSVVKEKRRKYGGSRCKKCNSNHEPKKCPAYGKVCRKCKKRNHFAVCCKLRQKVADGVYLADDETDSDGLDVLEVCNGRDNRDDWLITAAISGKDVQLKVDTGSQANLLPLSVFKKIVLGIRTRPTTAVLRSYSGGVISHIGTAQLHTKIKGVTANLDSLTTSARRAILGLKACRLYGLVNCVDAVASTDCSNGHVAADFPDLFQGLGCTKRVYRMVLKEGTVPVIQSARRVPQMLKRPLKEELDRMEAKGIIAKMEEPSDWDF
ncbi:uncharacterized protein K02A2.6-like isoform X1 [Ornithodoros turicata]|uniref:uncharacterized protein K02A2.6-like isoform X1 n=1 Tax=Ornithodoros turicata TaxID=34597 RepID=UPI003139617C